MTGTKKEQKKLRAKINSQTIKCQQTMKKVLHMQTFKVNGFFLGRKCKRSGVRVLGSDFCFLILPEINDFTPCDSLLPNLHNGDGDSRAAGLWYDCCEMEHSAHRRR